MDDDAIPGHFSGAERDALCDDTESKDEGMANLEEQDTNTKYTTVQQKRCHPCAARR